MVDSFGPSKSVKFFKAGESGQEEYPTAIVVEKNSDDILVIKQDGQEILLWANKKEVREFGKMLLSLC